MAIKSGAQAEPTSFDAVLGVSTLAVGLADVIWLSVLGGIFLGGEWDNSVALSTAISLIGLAMALGLAACAGIILRRMGHTGGPASTGAPLLAIGLRIGLLVLPILLAVLASGVWTRQIGLESFFLWVHYLVPTTLLLLVVALVNLKRSGAQDSR